MFGSHPPSTIYWLRHKEEIKSKQRVLDSSSNKNAVPVDKSFDDMRIFYETQIITEMLKLLLMFNLDFS